MMPQAAFQLLSTLLQVGPEGATRQHLVAQADIAVSTFYRLIRPLLHDGLVVEEGQRYRLPLGNLHNFRFKLWHDAQRLWSLAPTDRAAVLDIVTHARGQLQDNLQVLWLVGSAASDTLAATSDLDFLALVKEDVLYHPAGQRPVNFVVMTEAHFNEMLSGADDFVLAALRSGLVLFDAGRAQAIYERPLVVHLSSTQAQDAEAGILRQRERLFRFAKAEEPEMAAQALQAMAIKTAWLMLRTMNVLPPPKTHLVALCERYFGAWFADRVAQALSQPTTIARQLALNRDFEDIHHRFHQALSHLQGYATLPTAGGVEFEQLCLQLVRELFPHDDMHVPSDGPEHGIDLVVRHGQAVRYAFDCVSRDRLDLSNESFARKLERLSAYPHPVLLANVDRKVPVLDRKPPFSEAILAAAVEHGLVLRTGLDLLCAHNRLHLEELPIDQVARDLFGGTSSKRALPVLSEPAGAAPALGPAPLPADPGPVRPARRRSVEQAVDPAPGWYRGLGVKRPGLRTLHYIQDGHLLCGLHSDVLERSAPPPPGVPYLYFKPHPYRNYGDPFPCKQCQAVLARQRGAGG